MERHDKQMMETVIEQVVKDMQGRLMLTRQDTAKILSVSVVTVDRLTKRGLLHPNRSLRTPLYSIHEILRFVTDESLVA